jgi:hypothetical protein
MRTPYLLQNAEDCTMETQRTHEEESTPLPGFHYFGAHPRYTPEAWQQDVTAGQTRLSYWAWVRNEIRLADEHPENPKQVA